MQSGVPTTLPMQFLCMPGWGACEAMSLLECVPQKSHFMCTWSHSPDLPRAVKLGRAERLHRKGVCGLAPSWDWGPRSVPSQFCLFSLWSLSLGHSTSLSISLLNQPEVSA